MSRPTPRATGIFSFTVMATLPYLALKAVWVGGIPIGQRDPGILMASPYPQANLLSLIVDGAVIGLAWIFCTLRYKRTLGVLITTAMWIADGLLAPIALIVPLALPVAVATGVGGPTDPLHLWVYLLVYASLIAQGLLLNVAFLGSRRRNRSLGSATYSDPFGLSRRLMMAGAAATVIGLGSAANSWRSALTNIEGSPVARISTAAHASLLIAASFAVLHLLLPATRDPSGRKRGRAIGAVWVGSAAAVTWGGYELAVAQLMDVTPDVGTPGLIVQMIGGAALGAVAVLIVRRPQTSVDQEAV